MDNRRTFLKKSLLGGVALGAAGSLTTPGCTGTNKGARQENLPQRVRKGKSVMGLRCEPLPEVRIAIIGLGRGGAAAYRFARIEGAKITVICDLLDNRINQVQQNLKEAGRPEAVSFSGEEDWRQICERDDIDLVYNATPWELHVPIAVHAMKHGKHVAIEVPAAQTIDECWELVDTAEATQRHCAILENCCYDFFELNMLNMTRQGIFGEIIHADGAYLHGIPQLWWIDTEGKYSFSSVSGDINTPSWRLKHALNGYNGCQYPTHPLGPIAQIMGINRGDRFDYLTSMSGKQYGITEYAEKTFGKDSPEAKAVYTLGDMNSTSIHTANGHTITIQHNISTPRPYDRIFRLTGTKGFAIKYPEERLALDPNPEKYLNPEEFKATMLKYEHPMAKYIGEKARAVGGHGAMDFIMDWRLIYCLQNGLPLDIDVYDTAAWSSIVALSYLSVQNRSSSVDVPDFTYGDWKNTNPLPVIDMETTFC